MQLKDLKNFKSRYSYFT